MLRIIKRFYSTINKKYLVDDEIIYDTVRVLKDRKFIGDFNITEAKSKAKEYNLNLILFKANTNPPICIIDDFKTFLKVDGGKGNNTGKSDGSIETSGDVNNSIKSGNSSREGDPHVFSFDPAVKSKTIQISDNCATNDFNRKISTARKYITSGIRVDIVIFTKGNNKIPQQNVEQLLKYSKANDVNMSFNLNNPLLQKIDYIYTQLNDISNPFTVKNKINLNSRQIVLKFWPK